MYDLYTFMYMYMRAYVCVREKYTCYNIMIYNKINLLFYLIKNKKCKVDVNK